MNVFNSAPRMEGAVTAKKGMFVSEQEICKSQEERNGILISTNVRDTLSIFCVY